MNIALQDNTYSGFAVISPSDTALINCNAIYVGGIGGGTVNISIAYDMYALPVTFIGVSTGDILPIHLHQGRIMATNTPATNIVALQ